MLPENIRPGADTASRASSPMDGMTLSQAAYTYASKFGWRLFPGAPRSKRPLIPKERGGQPRRGGRQVLRCLPLARVDGHPDERPRASERHRGETSGARRSRRARGWLRWRASTGRSPRTTSRVCSASSRKMRRRRWSSAGGCEAAAERYEQGTFEEQARAGKRLIAIDPARYGPDKTALVYREGPVIRCITAWGGTDVMAVDGAGDRLRDGAAAGDAAVSPGRRWTWAIPRRPTRPGRSGRWRS